MASAIVKGGAIATKYGLVLRAANRFVTRPLVKSMVEKLGNSTG